MKRERDGNRAEAGRAEGERKIKLSLITESDRWRIELICILGDLIGYQISAGERRQEMGEEVGGGCCGVAIER